MTPKFRVIKQNKVENIEGFPKHFLGETLEEAEKTYKEYKGLLDSFAYMYSTTTGLDKHDLFGHALIGLAKAKRDFDPKRSDNFKTFAIFNIKDELNEALRLNGATVVIPTYIKKAISIINSIFTTCAKYGTNALQVIHTRVVPREFGEADLEFCSRKLTLLKRAAIRATITYEELVERILLVPQEVSYEDHVNTESSQRGQQVLEAAMVVEQLKRHMTGEEWAVCSGIMSDCSYEEIGKIIGKSPAWICKKLVELRKRFAEELM